jgi:NitT/TauT family transport system substrate-binding protein
MKKIVALFLILALFCFVSCAKEEEKVVKIGYLTLVMSLPTFVAQEKGFFEEKGLQVELIPFNSGTEIVDALVAGRIDANCGSASTGHWFAAQTAPDRFKIFMMYGTTSAGEDNTFVVVVKKDSPLTDLKGLKGKKVGTFPGATSVALAKLAIRSQIDPEGVIFAEIPPPNMVPALAAGQIDCFFTPEPMGMMAVSKGIGKYLMKSPLALLNLEGGVPGAAFSFNTQFLKERPKTAKKIKGAMEEAVDYIRANEQEVRSYLVKYTGLPEPVAMHMPYDKFITLDEINKNACQAYFDILYSEGAYKEKVDTTKLYYDN